jgi:hypothetical protein
MGEGDGDEGDEGDGGGDAALMAALNPKCYQ